MANTNGNKKVKINTLINWGASIVIIGLMFKILHWEGGEWMIGLGLAAEACLFFILGIQTLGEGNDVVPAAPRRPEPPATPKATDLDQLLSTSINHSTIERLNKGFEQFNKTVESVNDVAGHSLAAKDMVHQIEDTTSELKELKKNLAELNNIYRAQLEAFRKN